MMFVVEIVSSLHQRAMTELNVPFSTSLVTILVNLIFDIRLKKVVLFGLYSRKSAIRTVKYTFRTHTC